MRVTHKGNDSGRNAGPLPRKKRRSLSRGFTPPLTPPRHHAGGVSSTRREGNPSSMLRGSRSTDAGY